MKTNLFAILAPLALVSLAACIEQAPVSGPADGQTTDGACPADLYQGLITQNEVALATMAIPGAVRIIHPGDAVTTDYLRERMNIRIDSTGRISAVDCG